MTETKSPRDGRIIKGYGGFYYVDDGTGLWECRLRGRFRKEKQEVLAGDQVLFTVVDAGKQKGVVDEIRPRKNRLIRPLVANVDQALIVMAAKDPEPDLWLLDRLLIMILQAGIEPLLCWNKSDLASEDTLGRFCLPYEAAGIRQFLACAAKGEGVKELKEALRGRTTVLAGPSGVGKSSLLNCLEPGLTLKTGRVSEKLGRGRHTTRHVEWLPLSFGGWVADTPGFSQIYLPEGLSREELTRAYGEFQAYRSGCRFASCSHLKEQDCGIRQALAAGLLDEGRYQRYQTFAQELEERDKR